MGWKGRLLLAGIGILSVAGIPPLGAVDDGLHYANVFNGYDILGSGFQSTPRTGVWLQGGGTRGSLSMADGGSAGEDGRNLVAGGAFAIPRLPLTSAVEIFASRRGGHTWREETDAPIQDWD
ncbi:MAG: hypothetical protein LBH53_01585, partial [Puniceicoccales bacterium]|nr:hypothetical protein [Puniceicoccales bacterium]